MADKQRIVELQKSLRIARTCLEKIYYGHSHHPHRDAEAALEQIWKLDQKQPLQGLVGHERRPRP